MRRSFFAVLFSLFAFALCAQAAAPTKIRVACVGDSITYGFGLPHRDADSYPAVLARLLGDDYEVGNFGVSGATLLKKGHLPYWDQPAFREASEFHAQIVVIKLGTNDNAARNWPTHGTEFPADAAALIAHFKNLPEKPAVWVCLPAPAFATRTEEYSGNLPEIRHLLTVAAKDAGVGVIDTYTPLKGKGDLYLDNLHPLAGGYAIIAQTVFAALKPKDAVKP